MLFEWCIDCDRTRRRRPVIAPLEQHILLLLHEEHQVLETTMASSSSSFLDSIPQLTLEELRARLMGSDKRIAGFLDQHGEEVLSEKQEKQRYTTHSSSK